MDIRRRAQIGGIKKTSSGGGSTTGGSYIVNLNSQWEATTAVPNPDSTLYDGVYRSSSNYNVNSGVSIMYITIKDCSSFKMYIRSYAESTFDYVMVSQLDQTINGNTTYSDTTLVKAHTRGNQQSGTTLSSYTLVEYTGITSGEHTITVVYRKDSTTNSGDDRGYVLISKSNGSSSTPDNPGTGGDNTSNYMSILALEDGLTASLSDNACQYCIDGDGNWIDLPAGTTTQSINQGQTLSFKGNLTPKVFTGIGTFTISKKCNLYGNCMSLLFGDDAVNNYSISGSYAFYKLFSGCTTIIQVSDSFLPATTSGDYCYGRMFYGCNSLTTAPELPATTLYTSCYSEMFRDCTSLTKAPELPATTLRYTCYYCMFRGCSSLTTSPSILPATILFDSCYSSMFEGCSSLTTAPELPATTLVEECYKYMFRDCTSLTTAPELPATTLSYSCYNEMFRGCTSLTKSPELPATTLDSYCYNSMFYGCSKLNYIKMLATDISAEHCLNSWVYNVSSTGTFVKNPDMNSLTTGTSGIPSGWTVVDEGYYIMYTSSDGKIVTPYDTSVFGANIVSNNYINGRGIISFDALVTSIGNYAFRDCSSLTSVTIPGSVITIGSDAFFRCGSLTSVTIPDSVTTIGDYAFYDCSSLTSVTIGDSVTMIGRSAFYSCDSLTSVTIGDSVTTIGEKAFEFCSNLTSITIGDSVTKIGSAAFYGCGSLQEFNGKFASEDGRCLIVKGTLNSFAPAGLTEYIIPDSVTTIGWLAFASCSNLTSVTIPDSVTTIVDRAFISCSRLQEFKSKFATEDGRCLIINDALNSFAPAGLTEYIIPNGVTTIREYVFFNCSNLTGITIPDSVTWIGGLAFYDCSSLTSVYCKAITPPVLTQYNVFDYNGSGRIIYVPTQSVDVYKSADGWSEYADAIVGIDTTYSIIYTSSDGNIVTPNNTNVFGANIVSNNYINGRGIISFDAPVTTIGDRAFQDCSSLTSVTIPDSVTSIGEWAFGECSRLTSVTIHDSVTEIGGYAFFQCSSLTSVTIPDSVTTIGDTAFSGCTSLTSVYISDISAWCNISFGGSYSNPLSNECNLYLNNELVTYLIIPNSTTTIGDSAFRGCIFRSVTIPDSVNTIGNDAFSGCKNLTSVTIGDRVTSIGEGAFDNCRSLTSITIPDSVTTIGYGAFWSCSSLIRATIGNGVTTIGGRAFFQCSSLTSVTIPDSVTTIGQEAFYNCYRLTSVTIPDSVTMIGDNAFRDCSSLTSVYCKATTPPAGGSMMFFDNDPVRKIYVPAASVGAYKTAEYWSEYADDIISYDFENDVVSITNEIHYTATTRVGANSDYPWTSDTFGANVTSHEWDSESGEGVIAFDTDVTTIGDGAFYDCSSLTSVTIPDSVTSIGEWAFGECSSLTSITIPDSVTTIGDYAFEYCLSLTSVTIPDSVTTIGNFAFGYCRSLTSITIPDSVTTIGDTAFSGCTSLTSVTIPDSVTTIGDYAFSSCSKLTSVYCKAITPPPLGGTGVFDSNGSGRIIYVPTGSVDTYKSETNWSEYADAIVGYDFEDDGEESGNLITFIIDETEYQAEEGMTWGEWVDSEYNINGRFLIDLDLDNSIFDGNNMDCMIGTEEDYVSPTDIIQEGYNYFLVG